MATDIVTERCRTQLCSCTGDLWPLAIRYIFTRHCCDGCHNALLYSRYPNKYISENKCVCLCIYGWTWKPSSRHLDTVANRSAVYSAVDVWLFRLFSTQTTDHHCVDYSSVPFLSGPVNKISCLLNACQCLPLACVCVWQKVLAPVFPVFATKITLLWMLSVTELDQHNNSDHCWDHHPLLKQFSFDWRVMWRKISSSCSEIIVLAEGCKGLNFQLAFGFCAHITQIEKCLYFYGQYGQLYLFVNLQFLINALIYLFHAKSQWMKMPFYCHQHIYGVEPQSFCS